MRTEPLRGGTEPLRAEGLSVGYRGRPVAEGLDFAAEPGELTVLIGPNGAGKSTTLKTLLGQLPPVAGRVLLEGRDLAQLGERDRARRMAAVLTERPRPERMVCREVVEAGRYPYTGRLGLLSAEDRRIAREAMALTETEDLAERDFNRVSDGQRQRVLLARALCQQPGVLVMDEPTSFLDLRHKLEFLELLRTLVRERGMAAVLSLHELELAQRYAGRLVCLRGGRAELQGTPEEVFRGDYIRNLFGVERGNYSALLGCPEGAAPAGAPEVFVLGGGGVGIPVYRLLRRLGVPFAAGVLPENDADLPVARMLAAEVFTCPAPEAAKPGADSAALAPEPAEEAAALAARCRFVVQAAENCGPAAEKLNRCILEQAEAAGSLCRMEALPGLLFPEKS